MTLLSIFTVNVVLSAHSIVIWLCQFGTMVLTFGTIALHTWHSLFVSSHEGIALRSCSRWLWNGSLWVTWLLLNKEREFDSFNVGVCEPAQIVSLSEHTSNLEALRCWVSTQVKRVWTNSRPANNHSGSPILSITLVYLVMQILMAQCVECEQSQMIYGHIVLGTGISRSTSRYTSRINVFES